ncbi:MAG: thiol protease/hemagglutinin PrtT [Bacteroidetes bacterium]|nr:thiol protease/hemagglutinin PrtT [Bacteroidota bacterium]
MKRITAFLLITWLFAGYAIAQKIGPETALLVARTKAKQLNTGEPSINTYFSEYQAKTGKILYFAYDIKPSGYIIVSADSDLPPVIAWSDVNDLDNRQEFAEILTADIKMRLRSLPSLPRRVIQQRNKSWKNLMEYNDRTDKDVSSTQWPTPGTTTTGGWLESNWHQNSPYNDMCPTDPVTHNPSYAGCPAVAMAMIFNYHHTTNNTYFDDNDDYYHSYAGRNFWIDDDYASIGFPSFPDINELLDTLSYHYTNDIPVTSEDKAALTFACGIAATQVFTSEGSGTFGVDQAFDAYLRFGCANVELLTGTDTTLYPRLTQNMMDGYPAHLALVDESWSTGHNVVVDGYNTDGYYHLNFGWGGSANGWYLIPDEIPYSLTVIEGLIVDILTENTVHIQEVEPSDEIKVFPNPAHTSVTIENRQSEEFYIEIFNVSNRKVMELKAVKSLVQMDVSSLHPGIYLIGISTGTEFKRKKLVIY